MSITFNSVKCPECGANLPIEEGRKKVFCSYCGTPVIITNENEYNYRFIDEAGIIQSENSKEVRMRELDIEERQGFLDERLKKTLITIWLTVSFVLLIIGIGIMFFGGDMGPIYGFNFLAYVSAPIIGGGGYVIFKLLPEKKYEKYLKANGGIRFPKGLEPFSKSNYKVIYDSLLSTGFTNVTSINRHDLVLGLVKSGKVDKITVAGKDINSGGKVYMPNIPIIITYHGR